jgi:hypothetical protein
VYIHGEYQLNGYSSDSYNPMGSSLYLFAACLDGVEPDKGPKPIRRAYSNPIPTSYDLKTIDSDSRAIDALDSNASIASSSSKPAYFILEPWP